MSSRLILAGAYLLIILAASSNANAQEEEEEEEADVLRRFSAKLLLTVSGGSKDFPSRLDIEEIYDQERGLAKIIVTDAAQSERAELFYRGEDELYLESVYDLSGAKVKPKSCTAGVGGQPRDGKYFSLLKRLTQGASRRWSSVLLGPSVFLHKAQVDLLKRDRSRAQVDDAARHGRRRFIVEEEVALVQEYNDDEGARIVLEFSQADRELDRSPLLAQLAAFVSYSSSARLRYTIDYMEIDNSTQEHLLDLHRRDLFKLPQVRPCLGATEPPEAQFGFQSLWSRFFQIRPTRFSMNVHAENLHPAGVHVAADMQRHLMRFDVDKRSRNVVDLKHEFIYHMPLEPAPEAEVDEVHEVNATRSHKVRNGKCSLVSSKTSLPGLRAMNGFDMVSLLGSDGSANKWTHLIGRPESVVYLGMGRVDSTGQLAHEFELSYSSSSNLSPFVVILFGRDEWIVNEDYLLVGRLWLDADSCPQPVNSHRPTGCPEPIPLRVRLDLIQAQSPHKVIDSKQVQLTEFEWELLSDDDGAEVDKIHETFDRRACPVEKLELRLQVEWKEEITEDSFGKERPCPQHRAQLDDLIFSLVNQYLLTYASFDVELMDLQIREAVPGTQVAEYSLTLAELPEMANSFTRSNPRVSREALANGCKLLAKSRDFLIPFECLTWASQFGNSQGVLFSPKLGCFVYDKLDLDPEYRKPPNGDLFTMYERKVENFAKSVRNSVNGLKLFKSDHIDKINQDIRRSNRDENSYEACLSRPLTGQSLIRDIKLGKLRHQLSHEMHNRQLLPVKSGYMFSVQSEDDLVKSRRQFEVVSFIQCERRCNELPECASYSHCKNIESQHQFCQLSDLKLSSRIVLKPEVDMKLDAQNFARRVGCQLHSKDYLLYFETGRNGAELASVELRQWTRLAPASTQSQELSELECASLCHSKGVDCLRFLYCEQTQGCYYRQPEVKVDEEEEPPSLRVMNPSECSLFKKKSLGLYRRVMSIDSGPFDWTLDHNAGPQQLRTEVMPGAVGEEKCAQMCIENLECQSFDSCSSSFYAGPANDDADSIAQRRKIPHLVCVLLSHSQASGLILSSNESLPSAQNMKHCSHFERPPTRRKVSQAADVKHSSSEVFGLVCFSLLGLMLGILTNKSVKFLLKRRRQRAWGH